MPHTTRRKKPQYESKKLVNVSTGDGWSTVSRKPTSSVRKTSTPDPLSQDGSHQRRIKSHSPDNKSSHANHGRRILNGAPTTLHEHLTHSQCLALSLNSNPNSNHNNPNQPHNPPLPKPPDYTLSRVSADFTSRLKTYRQSHDAETVRHILTTLYGVERLRGIRKAIVLGSGSLSVADLKRGGLWQVAAFVVLCGFVAEVKGMKAQGIANWQKLSQTLSRLDLTKLLDIHDSDMEGKAFVAQEAQEAQEAQQQDQETQERGQTLQVYAQDPIYNTLDITFLQKYLGITVLSSPSAFDLIDSNTLVFAPHFGVNMWPECMRTGAAGIVIGNDVEGSLDGVAGRGEIVEYFREWRGRAGDGARRRAELAEGAKSEGGLKSEGGWKSEGGSGVKSEDEIEDEIPDVNIRSQLEEFLREHKCVKWPNTEERCQSSFNNLAFYWKEEDGEE